MDTNGNGTKRSRVERGVSLAHRRDSKSQRAAKAAEVYDGGTYQPTLRELSILYGVSMSTIHRARQLSPEMRHAVAVGRAKLPLPTRQLTLALPESTGNGKMDDVLFKIVRRVGIEKMLSVAAAVQAAAQ
jgi:hypothetical protein